MFYQNSLNATPDTLIRSSEANSQFSLVETGFNAVEIKTKASFKAPDGETTVTLPAAAIRANKSFVFDATGAAAVATAATSAQMDAAVAAAITADAAALSASNSAALVVGAKNSIDYLLTMQGII